MDAARPAACAHNPVNDVLSLQMPLAGMKVSAPGSWDSTATWGLPLASERTPNILERSLPVGLGIPLRLVSRAMAPFSGWGLLGSILGAGVERRPHRCSAVGTVYPALPCSSVGSNLCEALSSPDVSFCWRNRETWSRVRLISVTEAGSEGVRCGRKGK